MNTGSKTWTHQIAPAGQAALQSLQAVARVANSQNSLTRSGSSPQDQPQTLSTNLSKSTQQFKACILRANGTRAALYPLRSLARTTARSTQRSHRPTRRSLRTNAYWTNTKFRSWSRIYVFTIIHMSRCKKNLTPMRFWFTIRGSLRKSSKNFRRKINLISRICIKSKPYLKMS